MKNPKELEAAAKKLREELLRSHNAHKLPHIGSEFSCLDILVTLYVGGVLGKGDKFVLSKGHAAPALYAVLHKKGILSTEIYDSLGENGSLLAEHPSFGLPGIEANTGSLGHGLSIATGMALAFKLNKKDSKVFVLLSDGETQEGSTLEAMNSASRFKLDNLIAIIDSNKWQAYDRTSVIQPVSNTKKEFQAAGWGATEIDGHDYSSLLKTLQDIPIIAGSPSLIVANTVLGKGVDSFEDKLFSHYKPPLAEHIHELIQ